MEIEFDPGKEARNRVRHKMGFGGAEAIFDGFHIDDEDDREDYGETRFVTLGRMGKQVVVCVWTRGATRPASSASGRRRRMSEKSTISSGPDRDDPPRFTREMAERGRHMVGDQVIREARPRGRPPKGEGERKEKVTLRLSPEVLAHFRAQGEGWQTRIDQLLLDHIRFAMVPKEDMSVDRQGKRSKTADYRRQGELIGAGDGIVSMEIEVADDSGRRRLLRIDPKTGRFVQLNSPNKRTEKRPARAGG